MGTEKGFCDQETHKVLFGFNILGLDDSPSMLSSMAVWPTKDHTFLCISDRLRSVSMSLIIELPFEIGSVSIFIRI